MAHEGDWMQAMNEQDVDLDLPGRQRLGRIHSKMGMRETQVCEKLPGELVSNVRHKQI